MVCQNVGDIKTKGVEAEWNHRPTDWLKYTVGYTYIDSKYEEKAGCDFKIYSGQSEASVCV